jgi:hypothetical protein
MRLFGLASAFVGRDGTQIKARNSWAKNDSPDSRKIFATEIANCAAGLGSPKST